jgi:hypothetical protein
MVKAPIETGEPMKQVGALGLIAAIFFLTAGPFILTAAESDPVPEANRAVEKIAQDLVAAKGEARTFTYGPIVDDENNRKAFRVPALIADLTGLAFVPLAIIQHHGGDVALYAAVSGLSDRLPHKDEALKILARRQLMYFQRGYFESYFRDVPTDDPAAFSGVAAHEVWGAFKAEYGDLSSTDPAVLSDRYPEAADVAELIHVDLVPIAGIRAVAGISGLNEFLILMPDDLPGKDEAIKVLSKVKKK